MMKGQAFDTFKLMIAAVIAVAILGILLGILNIIEIPGAGASSIINQQLTQAYQFPGNIYVSSKANFKTGTTYVATAFKNAIGGAGTITFICGATLTDVCESSSDGSSVDIKGDFSAVIRACYNDNAAKVGIGADAIVSC